MLAVQHWADWLLRLVVVLEVPVYFGTALLHGGAHIPLGPLVLAVPNPIPDASVVETILGIAAMINVAALLRAKRPARITLGIQLFLLAGVSLGMFALSHFIGPPPSPDWNLHFVMLAGIAAALLLLVLRQVQGENT